MKNRNHDLGLGAHSKQAPHDQRRVARGRAAALIISIAMGCGGHSQVHTLRFELPAGFRGLIRVSERKEAVWPIKDGVMTIGVAEDGNVTIPSMNVYEDWMSESFYEAGTGKLESDNPSKTGTAVQVYSMGRGGTTPGQDRVIYFVGTPQNWRKLDPVAIFR